MVTNYRQWTDDGSPWAPAACIADFATTMRGHGYTVYVIGAVDTHLDIPDPEDHAPYSHTPWPGPQPYPKVNACDIMPDGPVDLAALGAQIVADRNAGVPGTGWIKYVNWTDGDGNCWHDSWMPDHAQWPSGDTGHIHISSRTDYVNAHTAYDPLGGHQAEAATVEDDTDMSTGMIPVGFAYNDGPRKDTMIVGLGLGPVNGGQFGNKRVVLGLGADFTPAAGVLLRVALKAEGQAWAVKVYTVRASDNRVAIFLPDGCTKVDVGRVKRATGDVDTLPDGSTLNAETCPVWWDLEFEKR